MALPSALGNSALEAEASFAAQFPIGRIVEPSGHRAVDGLPHGSEHAFDGGATPGIHY